MRLGGQFSAWPCHRHLRPLEFRRSCDYRTSRRHSKDPIEWLIRWGWPAPRLVLAFNYIAVEARPLCLTCCDNQIFNSILATPLHILYRFRITTQSQLSSLNGSVCPTAQALFQRRSVEHITDQNYTKLHACIVWFTEASEFTTSRLQRQASVLRQLCQKQTRSATRLHHSCSQPLQVVYLYC